MKHFLQRVVWVDDRLRVVEDDSGKMSVLFVERSDGSYRLGPLSDDRVPGSCGGLCEASFASDLDSAVVMLAMYFASWNSDLEPLIGAKCSNNDGELIAKLTAETVTCVLCGERTSRQSAHLHQDGWIGDECCWDERLRASE